MSFAVNTSSFRLERRRSGDLQELLRIALIGGVATVYLCLIGIVPLMASRFVVFQAISVSHLLVGSSVFAACWWSGRQTSALTRKLLSAILCGVIIGFFLAVLVEVINSFELRQIIVTAGPPIVRVLMMGTDSNPMLLLPGAGAFIGLMAGLFSALTTNVSKSIILAVVTLIFVAFLKDVGISLLANFPSLRFVGNVIYGPTGLRTVPAICLSVIAFAAFYLNGKFARTARREGGGQRSQTVTFIALGLLALVLPLVTNVFIGQIMLMVCLYILMSAGLNIELGYAGLVDLGFVAFFAIGAYTVALFGSTSAFAVGNWSFWLCLPAAVAVSAIGGLVFGLPVLRVRGDYLAMATLGLGEIVRVLVLSDALKPALGASMGIGEISPPVFFGFSLTTPTQLYYLGILLVAVVIVASIRLKASKVGRAWLALREDEDVAQALSIDPVLYKLIAYITGAAFAGAAGAVFAVLIGGVYPHSFQLIVSMNVLAILIIGGLGSIPGVICGALVLVGVPELLREFGEYRYLMYGLVLVAMMHFKPDGLWPRKSVMKGVGK